MAKVESLKLSRIIQIMLWIEFGGCDNMYCWWLYLYMILSGHVLFYNLNYGLLLFMCILKWFVFYVHDDNVCHQKNDLDIMHPIVKKFITSSLIFGCMIILF